MKRGQVESYSFLIGILIAIAFIVVLGMFLAGFFSGESEKELAGAKDEFLNVSEFYKKCVSNSKDSCFCGSFSMSEIRGLGYSLYLVKMLGQSNLILTEFGVVPDSDGLIAQDLIVEKFPFEEDLVCTSGYEDGKIVDTPLRNYDFAGGRATSGDSIPVLKRGSKFCVYANLNDGNLEKLKGDFAGCNAFLDSGRLVLIDSAEDVASRQIAVALLKQVSESVGRAKLFDSAKYESRDAWFGEVYAKEGQTLAGKVFLLNVRTSAGAPEDTKDKIVLHYLQGSSEGEALAKSLGMELATLNGKYYYNSLEEAALGSVPEMYRFNIDIVYEANNVESPGGVYLVCDGSSLPVCKENDKLPAVFVEFVDANDGFSVYQGHEDVLAKSMQSGLLNYARSPSVYRPASQPSDQPLFQ